MISTGKMVQGREGECAVGAHDGANWRSGRSGDGLNECPRNSNDVGTVHQVPTFLNRSFSLLTLLFFFYICTTRHES